MKKLVYVLFIVMAFAGTSSLASAGSEVDSTATETAYDISPDYVGSGIYFVDLNELRTNWLNQTGADYSDEARRVANHFDELLANAIARWRKILRAWYENTDIISIVPTSNRQGGSTTGLIIAVSRDIPQAAHR